MDPLSIALTLGKLVPDVVGWLQGPRAQERAERVLQVAKEVTGHTDPVSAVQAIELDPSLLLQFKTRARELDLDFLKTELADVQDARARDIEIRKLSGGTNERADRMVIIDAAGLTLGLASMLLLGVGKAMYPEAVSEGVFGALLAQLSTITSYFGLSLRDAHQYEFGSSRGSLMKNAWRKPE